MNRFSLVALLALATPALADPLVFAPEVPESLAGLTGWLDTQGRVPGATYAYAAADLDGDGVDEALMKVTEPTWCNGDMDHCRVVIMRLEEGTWETYGYPYAKDVTVLDSVTAGWKDLQIDDHVEIKGEGEGIHYMTKP